MIDLIYGMIAEVRSAERASAYGNIAAFAEADGYDIALQECLNLAAISDSSMEVVEEVESKLSGILADALKKIGIIIGIEHIYGKPIQCLQIYEAVTRDIEASEDKESLYSILESDDNEIGMISNIVSELTGETSYQYIDILESVEPKLVRVIRSTISSEIIANNAELVVDELPKAETKLKLISAFLLLYPNNIIHDLLDDMGFILPESELLESIDLGEPDSEDYEETTALVAAGILLSTRDTLDDALSDAEELVSDIVDDYQPLEHGSIVKAAGNFISTTWETIENEED